MAKNVLGSTELALVLGPFLDFGQLVALGQLASLCKAPAEAAVRRRAADLYIIGGSTGLGPLRSVEHFSQENGRWEAAPPMARPRVGATGAALGGRLFVCGGCDGTPYQAGARILKSAERYDPWSRRWEALPDMLEGRRGASGAALGGRLYVCGGEGGVDGEYVLSSVERFSPAQGVWETAPPMQAHRFAAAATAARGGLCVFGGSVGLDWLGHCERLVPGEGEWREMPELQHGRVGAAAAAVGADLWVCGGGQAEQLLTSVERLRDGAGCWEPGPRLQRGFRLAASAVVCGRLLVCGGQPATGPGLRSCERLDLEAAGREELPPLAAPRAWATALCVR